MAGQPNRVWLADITYIATQEGSLYLAFILDTHSRRIVGWSMDSHMRTELVVDALEMAVWRRKPSAGLVHHSDRGVQYTAISFGERLAEVGIVPSMGRTGSALDNAMAESFVATLKTELSLPQHLSHQAGVQDGDLRIHRGLLQHEKEALRAKLSEPSRVRGG